METNQWRFSFLFTITIVLVNYFIEVCGRANSRSVQFGTEITERDSFGMVTDNKYSCKLSHNN